MLTLVRGNFGAPYLQAGACLVVLPPEKLENVEKRILCKPIQSHLKTMLDEGENVLLPKLGVCEAGWCLNALPRQDL